MDIYLVRHTQTATPKGLCYGQKNVALAESFEHDVAMLKQKLPALKANCRVYSSELDRCLSLANQFSSLVKIDARLLELNFGEWEGLNFNDIPDKSLQFWTDNFVDYPAPKGESFTDLVRRVSDFWSDLITTDAEQVLIVTHAGVIRALLAHLLNCPLANAFQFQVAFGSVHKLRYENQYLHIEYLNL
jgi:alpha-ribazole phosphatase